MYNFVSFRLKTQNRTEERISKGLISPSFLCQLTSSRISKALMFLLETQAYRTNVWTPRRKRGWDGWMNREIKFNIYTDNMFKVDN